MSQYRPVRGTGRDLFVSCLALLFGATGLTLNHQDFGFSDPHVARSEIVLDKQLAAQSDQAALERYLRERLGIRSPSTDYHDDPDQIQVTFAAPGARTVVTINRQDGRAEVEKEILELHAPLPLRTVSKPPPIGAT